MSWALALRIGEEKCASLVFLFAFVADRSLYNIVMRHLTPHPPIDNNSAQNQSNQWFHNQLLLQEVAQPAPPNYTPPHPTSCHISELRKKQEEGVTVRSLRGQECTQCELLQLGVNLSLTHLQRNLDTHVQKNTRPTETVVLMLGSSGLRTQPAE